MLQFIRYHLSWNIVCKSQVSKMRFSISISISIKQRKSDVGPVTNLGCDRLEVFINGLGLYIWGTWNGCNLLPFCLDIHDSITSSTKNSCLSGEKKVQIPLPATSINKHTFTRIHLLNSYLRKYLETSV